MSFSMMHTASGIEAVRVDNRTQISMRWVRSQFQRSDDGAGGKLQTLRRGAKFWWRCWWNAEPLHLSLDTFSDGALDPVVESEPGVPLRPLRSYLRRGLRSSARARAVWSHFTWLSSNLGAESICRLYLGGRIGLADADLQVSNLGISLSRAGHLGREGELALHLEWRGARVMSLAFSVLDARIVVDAGTEPRLLGRRAVAGSIQGVRGSDAALRELSTACQRLRPSALLVVALQALSQAWGLEAPLGVAGASHVYAGYASRRRHVGLDYDAAWQDSGGELVGRHYWLLPERARLRPEREVESRRRAQHRRRNELREGMHAAVHRSAGQFFSCNGQGAPTVAERSGALAAGAMSSMNAVRG